MFSATDEVSKTLGNIASMQTLTERYPVLQSAAGLLMAEWSGDAYSEMLIILKLLGIGKDKLVRWISELLADKDGDGFLAAIEIAVKTGMMAAMKSMYTNCSVDPFIPDMLMDKVVYDDGQTYTGMGIEVNLDTVNLNGALSLSPTSEDGNPFYFDIQKTPDEQWKSTDMDAYIWYLVNRMRRPALDDMDCWDNRGKYYRNMKKEKDFRDRFFIAGEKRKKILRMEYVERSESTYANNILKVHICGDTYGKRKSFGFNHTIFEFNYDYISSLRLFDAKTLTARIIDGVFGITSNLAVSATLNERKIEAEVRTIVSKIMKDVTSDTDNSDTYFKFTNDEMDAMQAEAEARYNGQYSPALGTYDRPNYNEINASLRSIDDTDTITEAMLKIENTLNLASSSCSDYTPDTDESFGDFVADFRKRDFVTEVKIVESFMTELMTQMALICFSPKVMILYTINAAMAHNGDVSKTPLTDAFNYETYISEAMNFITGVTKTIVDTMMKELYKFVIKSLQPVLELFANKMAMETVRNYKNLIEGLITACSPSFALNNYMPSGPMTIDNVTYADIVPNATNSENIQTAGRK